MSRFVMLEILCCRAQDSRVLVRQRTHGFNDEIFGLPDFVDRGTVNLFIHFNQKCERLAPALNKRQCLLDPIKNISMVAASAKI